MAAVPAAFQGWVNSAASALKVPPALVAAQINQESGFNTKATSPTGAQGMAQFEPDTWNGLGIKGSPYDPNAALQGYTKYMGSLLQQYQGNVRNALAAYNAGPGNLQAGYGYADTILSNAGAGAGGGGSYTTGGQVTSVPIPTPQLSLTVPTFDQAGYDKANAKYKAGSFLSTQNKASNPYYTKGSSLGPNPLFGPKLLTTSAPDPSQYEGTKQVQLAQNKLQLLSETPLVVHPDAAPAGNYKGYVNPVPNFSLGRTDMGVDANAAPGSPIKAIGDSQLVNVQSNWYKGQPLLEFKLLNGPQAGKYWYVSEQIQPKVKLGQVVHAGDTVATFAPSGTGIEIGWGAPSGQTEAQATTGYYEGQPTPAGQNFKAFLNSLGA